MTILIILVLMMYTYVILRIYNIVCVYYSNSIIVELFVNLEIVSKAVFRILYLDYAKYNKKSFINYN